MMIVNSHIDEIIIKDSDVYTAAVLAAVVTHHVDGVLMKTMKDSSARVLPKIG